MVVNAAEMSVVTMWNREILTRRNQMKFTVNMKDPDVLQDAIEEAVKHGVIEEGMEEDEIEALREMRTEKIKNLCRTWFEYGEYLRVEIDTEAKTCTVIPVR
jgi:hypothetical protein